MTKINIIEQQFVKNYLDCLKKINLNKHKNIYLVSNLNKIGRIKIPKNKKLKIILDGIEKIVGNNFTIFSPSASMNLINTNTIFDLKNTPSYKMGAFSEYIRKLNGSKRSYHPFWSLTAIGPMSEEITKDVSDHGYDSDSAFAKLFKIKNSFFLSIGDHPRFMLSIVHHFENMFNVPYRFTKKFKIKCLKNNNIKIEYFKLDVLKDDYRNKERSFNKKIFENFEKKKNYTRKNLEKVKFIILT